MQILKQLLQKPAFQQSDVVVLGGGISGITTALVLQSIGLKPVIVADYVPRQIGKGRPIVPSDFAMASAYPHHLQVKNLAGITDDSQEVFAHLAREARSGVGIYRMYEVFEQEPAAALLCSKRLNFKQFDGLPNSFGGSIKPPIRPTAEYIWGWRFETYFADMPIYLDFLWSLYEERGGQSCLAKVEPGLKFAGRPIINCLGRGSLDVFEDSSTSVVLRGRQVLVPGAPMIADQDYPIAFNYTPSAAVYARADGNPEYVHFFPRSDGWVLGQTREPGNVDADGTWSGAAVRAEEVIIDGIPIPKPIIDLNDALVNTWRGSSIGGRRLTARQGYRYYRDPSGGGVRLELEEKADLLVVHNYGHGGSGVTVSWGCAVESVRLLLTKLDGQVQEKTTDPLDRLLNKLVSNSSCVAA